MALGSRSNSAPKGTTKMSDVASNRSGAANSQLGAESARKIPTTPADAMGRVSFLMNSGKLEEAEHACRQILRARPKYAAAHNGLGVIKLWRGATKEAIKSVEQAIKLTGTVAIYHANLGEALRQDGQIDRAIMALRRATQLDPKLGSAFNNLGLAYWDKEKFEDARECFDRALELLMVTMTPHDKCMGQQPTLEERVGMRWLILTRGAPGAGKTTFLQDLGLRRFVIDPDQIRCEIGGLYDIGNGVQKRGPFDNAEVVARVRDEIRKRMQYNEPIIVDTTLQRLRLLLMPLSLAKKFGYCVTILDFSMVPEETAQLRNQKRKGWKYVSPRVISNAYQNFRCEPLPKGATSISYLAFAESKLCQMIQNELRKITHTVAAIIAFWV